LAGAIKPADSICLEITSLDVWHSLLYAWGIKSMDDSQESILTFPLQFPLKVIGTGVEDFEIFVVEIVEKHISEVPRDSFTSRLSSNGNYLSVSVEFTAENREQLDNLYRELSSHKRVKMIL
jgi:putative lipoic acid-binding regulatory protein